MSGHITVKIVALSACLFAIVLQAVAGSVYRNGEIIVKFRNAAQLREWSWVSGEGRKDLSELFNQLGISEVQRFDEALSTTSFQTNDSRRQQPVYDDDDELIHSVSLLRFDTTRVASIDEAISLLSAFDEVELAEPNFLSYIQPVGEVRKAAPAAPLGEQWALEAINMPALWQMPIVNTRRPVIAIVDTGVDANHPDLQGNIANGGYNFVEKNGDVTDHHGHGTHCAGIVAARGVQVSGANPNALILPMVVADSLGSSSLWNIMLGITSAVNQGADIVSISLGCYLQSSLYRSVVNRAAEKAIVVAAAGNEGFCMHSTHRDLHGMAMPHKPCLPGAYESTIGVMATQEDGQLAIWSNFDCNGPLRGVTQEGFIGWGYQLRVPGNNILSTLPDNSYGMMSGTSMATPLAAGAISRLMQCRNFESREQMLRALIMTTRDHIDVMAAYEASEATLHPGQFKETIDNVECTFVETSDSTAELREWCLVGGEGRIGSVPYQTFTVPDVVRGLSVTALAPQAFHDCRWLTSINLGCNMETIGDQCFTGCDNLKELTFETRFPPSAPVTAFDSQHYQTVTLRNARGYAENYNTVSPWDAFINWREKELTNGSRFWETIDPQDTRMSFIIYNLTKRYAQLGDGEVSIDTLRTGSLVIPDSVRGLCVRIIGDYAFKDCKKLTAVTLPAELASIWTEAFSGCSALEAIYSPMTSPPKVLNDQVFSDYDKPTLYVPVGSRTHYTEAPTWKRFKNIQEMTFSGISDALKDKEQRTMGKHSEVYDLQGRRIAITHHPSPSTQLMKGLYIQNGRKVVVK